MVLAVALAGTALAGDWPPTLDTKNTTVRSVDGRTIERYVHGPRPSWGYPVNPTEWGYPAAQETGALGQNHDSFYLVAPRVPRTNAPLCVVLHSANRTAYDYLGYASLNRKADSNDGNPAGAVTNSPDDFYALYLNSTNAEWWGWSQAQQSPVYPHAIAAAPAESRVLDTIEWVVTRYPIDRNRIYLCGMSMGGCGTLALGLAHGDIFAAAAIFAPAGTEYASYRTGGFAMKGLTDPPVMVDFSSQTDNWSRTQGALVQAAQTGYLPLVLSWGPFVHCGARDVIGKYPLCAVALAYPWLEIRKNEAYPVFTHASCDQRAPWPAPTGGIDESGQSNALFRWKNERDTPSGFAMQIWIAHPVVAAAPTLPDKATADVTLRRLQEFKVEPGRSYTWLVSTGGQADASGVVKPDGESLLTIPRVTLTTGPSELSVKPNGG